MSNYKAFLLFFIHWFIYLYILVSDIFLFIVIKKRLENKIFLETIRSLTISISMRETFFISWMSLNTDSAHTRQCHPRISCYNLSPTGALQVTFIHHCINSLWNYFIIVKKNKNNTYKHTRSKKGNYIQFYFFFSPLLFPILKYFILFLLFIQLGVNSLHFPFFFFAPFISRSDCLTMGWILFLLLHLYGERL